MPRYYFHVLNEKMLNVGIEVTHIDVLKAEAARFAGTVLLSKLPTDIWKGIAWQLKVTDSPSLDEGQTHLMLTITATEGQQ